MRAKQIIESPFTLGLLTGLYPALFFITNNWFVIGVSQSFYVLCVLSIFAFLTIALANFFLNNLPLPGRDKDGRFCLQPNRLPRGLVRAILFVLSCCLFMTYLQLTIQELGQAIGIAYFHYLILLGIAFIFIGTLAWAHKNNGRWIDLVKHLNVFLIVMTVLSTFNLAFTTVTNFEKIFGAEVFDSKDANSSYHDIRFKSKPNVYLIVPDSYPSNLVLKRFFDLDNRPFSEELEGLGFQVYDDYFSSYPFSLESMHSMLSMEHNYYGRSIGNDAVNMRAMIAGQNSAVIDIFRNNGYKSVYIHASDYLLREGCFVEKCFPALSEFDTLLQTLKNFYIFNSFIPTFSFDSESEMDKQIDNTEPESQTFIYNHIMSVHSGLKWYAEHYTKQLPDFRERYPVSIKAFNSLLLGKIRHITDRDPTGLIIIVADHGTWAGAKRTSSGLTEDEVLDKFSTFLAIKWGVSNQHHYDDSIKSSVNLFRYIFAYLSQNERILETMEKDQSYQSYVVGNGVWIVVEDGKVLKKPKSMSPEP